jgi:hypothetical protein
MRVSMRALIYIGVFSLLCVAPASTYAQSKAPSPSVGNGQETFQQSCAVCHGKQGKGNGMAASSLNPPPSDLTTLAKRNGGAFPSAHLVAVLKGTDSSKAHSSTMMIWRALFLADAKGNEAAADARVNELVAFIQSLQVK